MSGDVAFAMVAVVAFATAGLVLVVAAVGWTGDDFLECLLLWPWSGERMRFSGPLPPGVPSSGG